MKISLNSIKDIIGQSTNFDFKATNFDQAVINKIANQLGAIESLEDIGDKYQGIVIAKIISVKKHPNADRLHVCLIDDGGAIGHVERTSEGLVQVICGANNVREGLVVAWLPPGSIVPESFNKQPFQLTTKDIRGVLSNGMLASPKELALSDDHQGILEITDDDISVGQDFALRFNLKNDQVIDIENKMFTHRPDCFGYIGIARELVAIFGQPFTSPDWYKLEDLPEISAEESLSFKVINQVPGLAKRFLAIAIKDVSVQASPVWLQVELAKVGLKPINNIVDITNYIMILSGQPLHAYDYDKVRNFSDGIDVSLLVRQADLGEKLKLLNGKEINLQKDSLVIASNKQAIGLAGIMGGQDTAIDNNTKNIILECATFDMSLVRRASMTYGIFSDASTRFTKNQSPLQNKPIIYRAVSLITDVAGGQVASQLIDDNHLTSSLLSNQSNAPVISISSDFINLRLGLKLTAQAISQILSNAEFKVELQDDQSLLIKTAFWRTDITIAEDIVEEVGRLYGLDKIPLNLPIRPINPKLLDKDLKVKDIIRTKLAGLGANEILTYSFVSGDLLEKCHQQKDQAFEISNAIRPELQYYRLSLMPSLLNLVHANIKAGYNQFALFEIGKVHNVKQIDSDNLPKELNRTALLISQSDKLVNSTSPYYLAKLYLSNLLKEDLIFKRFDQQFGSSALASVYEPLRSASIHFKREGQLVGVIGEFKTSIKQALKLPNFCSGFEIDNQVIAQSLLKKPDYQPKSRYPLVSQDLTLSVSSDTDFAEVLDFCNQQLNNLKPNDTSFNFVPVSIYQGQDQTTKNISLRLKIVAYDHTLTDKEVSNLLDKLEQDSFKHFQV